MPPRKRIRLRGDARVEELQKAEQFRRAVPHLTANALTSVLSEVTRVGVPALASRDNLREARDMTIDVRTPYGLVVKALRACRCSVKVYQSGVLSVSVACRAVFSVRCVIASTFHEECRSTFCSVLVA